MKRINQNTKELSKNQLESILREIDEGVTVQNPQGQIIYANKAALISMGLKSISDLNKITPDAILSNFELMDKSGKKLPPSALPSRIALEEKISAEKTLRFFSKKTKEEHWSAVRSIPILDDQKKIDLVVNIFQDITSRKQIEHSLQFLAEASRILASSLNYETTLTAVANLAVAKIADWCAVDILNEGKIELLAAAHINPKKVAWAKKLRKDNPPILDSDEAVPRVLKTGKSEFYPIITEEMIKQTAKSKKQYNLIKKLGLTSAMIVPLMVNKKPIGAITFISAESHKYYSQDDLYLAEQLASYASVAIENAVLYRRVQDERKRLNNVIDNVPGVVWEAWGKPNEKDQRIDFISDYIEEMLGYSVSEWLSTPNFWLTVVHPEDKERAAKESLEIFKSGKAGVSQFRWVTKDKKVIWVESQSAVIKDEKGQPIGMRGVTLDITEQKEAEVATQKLAAIVQSSDDAIIGKNLHGIITSWNKGAEKLYGYTAKEAVGKHISLIMPSDKKEEFLEIMEVIRMGESIDHFETTRVKKDGRPMDVAVTISPLKDTQGKVTGASVIARDISESKELERRKDAFISMASHELKTPITTIKAFIQVLIRKFQDSEDEQVKSFLNKTDAQLNRLTELVSDLLDLSKIQAGRLDLSKEKFDIAELIKSTIENIQPTTDKHQIILENEDKVLIKADKNRIDQVLINLINNAIKYSPEGDKIIVRVFKSDSKVTVSVKDFGIGISKTHLAKIFDRFYRAAGVSEKTFPGLGIGLFISSEIIKRHGGNIWVESVKRKGSTFSFSLPLK